MEMESLQDMDDMWIRIFNCYLQLSSHAYVFPIIIILINCEEL